MDEDKELKYVNDFNKLIKTELDRYKLTLNNQIQRLNDFNDMIKRQIEVMLLHQRQLYLRSPAHLEEIEIEIRGFKKAIEDRSKRSPIFIVIFLILMKLIGYIAYVPIDIISFIFVYDIIWWLLLIVLTVTELYKS